MLLLLPFSPLTLGLHECIYPQALVYFLRQGLPNLPRQTLNFQSSCLHPLISWDYRPASSAPTDKQTTVCVMCAHSRSVYVMHMWKAKGDVGRLLLLSLTEPGTHRFGQTGKCKNSSCLDPRALGLQSHTTVPSVFTWVLGTRWQVLRAAPQTWVHQLGQFPSLCCF